jgi:translation initiation factor 2B subunit (eIF-2B alpha/beta/delta family)
MEDLSACQEVTTVRGEVVRIRLLAAVFRLADTLHKDVSRFDPDLYAMIQISSAHRASRLHWLKSYVVSNIHLDEVEQTLTVQLSLPDFRQFVEISERGDVRKTAEMARNWEERIRNLKYVIATDIEEDLVVVNEEFSKNGMPTYVTVSTPVTYVRGYRKQYYSDIDSVLSELDILFSPNTSKVISQAIDSLSLHYRSSFGDETKYHNLSSQILLYLREIYDDRPCHVGLGKIIGLLEPHLQGKETEKGKLADMLKHLKEYRDMAMGKLCDRVEDIIRPNVRKFVLFGYSSTVIALLKRLSSLRNREKEKMEVIVLECAPKRRLGHSNVIEYNDGIHYANEIGKLDFYKVRILPDIGLATLLAKESDDKTDLKGTSLVLFGANGIDKGTGDCGHTSGHLAVAIVAKHFGIPVEVVADSFKIGEIHWNKSAERKGDWLVTQKKYVEELRNNYVEMKNLREDRIPVGLIWEIHTEDRSMTFWRSEDPQDCHVEGQAMFRKVCAEADRFMNDLKEI